MDHEPVANRLNKNKNIAYPFHFQDADDAVRIFVHKTLYRFYSTKKTPHVAATNTKMTFVGSNASFSPRLLFTLCKITCDTDISSHCLAALPATDVRVQQSHVAKRRYNRI